MKCRDLERLLCDYVDGALAFERRREFDDHLLGCAACSQALAEAEFGAAVMREAESLDPPADLIADIIHDTIGIGGAPAPALAGGGSGGGFWGALCPVFDPFLRPRFAMSMAMTALSFSMLTFCGRGTVEKWRGVAASPAALERMLEDGLESARDRLTRTYESVLTFYELQTEFTFDPGTIEPTEQWPPAEPADNGRSGEGER